MARFPIRESDILRLAQDVSKGLKASNDVYPAPPMGPDDIDKAVQAYETARDASMAASSRALQATGTKTETLLALVAAIKSDLKYAEATARNDNGKLQLLAWGARRKRTPTVVPGQVIALEVRQEGRSWVTLRWRKPLDGGLASAYKIQRRKRDSGDWIDVGTAMDVEITLDAQDPGIEWEYRVIALNKTGAGLPSNSVRAVL